MKNDKPVSASAIIKQRISRINSKRGYYFLIRRILIIALIVYLLLSQVFMIIQARGNAMFPAVKDGDLLIASRLQREYMKDDIVIFTTNGENRVGKVIAKGGDVVEITESGVLIINGAEQNGENTFPANSDSSIKYPYHIPKGKVFIRGDYRTQFAGNQHFETVSLNFVKAKVITLLRRRGI